MGEMMLKEDIHYSAGSKALKGVLCHESSKEKKPGIIIFHAWMGLDKFARQKAEELAKMGYAAFAADLYGIDEPVKTPEEAQKLMFPLFLDRKLLQERVLAAFNELSNRPEVDRDKIGAIGFCFGGLSAIELYRSGAPVKRVVSFHGVLANQIREHKAKTVPLANSIKGSILLLHGHDDPLVSRTDIKNLEDEFSQAKLDWQFHEYGGVSHAFTNPEAHDHKSGLVYDPTAAKRAWLSMQNFFEEVF